VILSCALFSNWLPLLVVATYVLAPLPNAICSRYAAGEDFMSDSSGYLPPLEYKEHRAAADIRSAYHDLGKFLTGFLVVTGLGMLFLDCTYSSIASGFIS
jgi:Vacuolar protein sorting 55